jgi:putative cell wall-binding protein
MSKKIKVTNISKAGGKSMKQTIITVAITAAATSLVWKRKMDKAITEERTASQEEFDRLMQTDNELMKQVESFKQEAKADSKESKEYIKEYIKELEEQAESLKNEKEEYGKTEYLRGLEEGAKNEKDDAFDEGYAKGFKDGSDDSFDQGYAAGLKEGQKNGIKQGKKLNNTKAEK